MLAFWYAFFDILVLRGAVVHHLQDRVADYGHDFHYLGRDHEMLLEHGADSEVIEGLALTVSGYSSRVERTADVGMSDILLRIHL